MIEIVQIILDVKTMDISFWGLIVFTSFISFAGGYLGTKMANRFSAERLTFIIGVAVILMGIFFTAQALWHL